MALLVANVYETNGIKQSEVRISGVYYEYKDLEGRKGHEIFFLFLVHKFYLHKVVAATQNITWRSY